MGTTGRMVIFGCGYLGREVARKALQKEIEVVALTRNPEDAERIRELGVRQTVIANLHEQTWHQEVPSAPDVVIISVNSGGRGVAGYRESYIDGVRSVLRYAKTKGPIGTLIFISSTSVYAQNDGGWIAETDAADGSTDGAKVLREAEELLMREIPGVGRIFILRLGGIYGPGRHHLLDRARVDEVSSEKKNSIFLNAIRVEDAASAVMAAAYSSSAVTGGIFNIVDDSPTPREEILRFLRESVKAAKKNEPAETPSFPGKRRRSGPRPNRRISNQKAKKVLGWKPEFPDFRKGYKDLL